MSEGQDNSMCKPRQRRKPSQKVFYFSVVDAMTPSLLFDAGSVILIREIVEIPVTPSVSNSLSLCPKP